MRVPRPASSAHWDARLTDLGLAKVILQDPSLRYGRYVMTGGTGCVLLQRACPGGAAR
jgi:hypothetical protein